MYGARAKSELKKLDNIQSRALRICCGAIRSTSLDAMKVEMMPLDLRREKLVMMYWVNLQGSRGGLAIGSTRRIPAGLAANLACCPTFIFLLLLLLFIITFTFTFIHLADAFIQSDLHCIQVTVFTFDQLLLSLGNEPMMLALLAPCSTI